MKRYLVTGASGFVGPHVVDVLESFGHHVVTTDLQQRSNPAADAPQQSTEFHLCDLTETNDVRDLVTQVKPDVIIHLASVSSVAHSFADPQQTLQTNLLAACNVLEALRHAAPNTRLLIIGSAEQYGIVSESELPLGESHSFQPASPYAVAKVAQEFLAQQYRQSFDLDIVLTRSFNHSGPGQLDRFVLPTFARQIAEIEHGEQEPILKVGNLEVARDFLDVRDVAKAYVQLTENGVAGEAYNVCRGQAFPLKDLLQAMLDASSSKIQVEVDPERLRPADLPVLCGDSSKLTAATGWQPCIDVDRMMQDILQDWRQRVVDVRGAS